MFPFLPVLGAVVYRHLGRLRAVGALGLSLVATSLLSHGSMGAAIWLGQWVAQGPVLAELLGRSWSLSRAMGTVVLVSLGLQGALLGIWALQSAEAPWSLVGRSMEAAFQRAMELYGQGGMTPDETARMKEGASRVARLAVALAPGVFASTNLFLHWWTMILCRRFPLLWRAGRPGPERLDEWGIPYQLVWVTILGGVLLLLPVEMLGALGGNLLIFMGSVHLLQGMAVLANLFRKRSIPPFLRGMVYALVFLQQFLLLAVAAMGLFDLWFDFRKRWGSPTLRA
jgi:hypothetical protein